MSQSNHTFKDHGPEVLGFVLSAIAIAALVIFHKITLEAGSFFLLIAGAFFLWLARMTRIRINLVRRQAMVRASVAAEGRVRTGLRALVAEKVSDPIILIDAAQKIMFANRAAKKLIGKKQKGKELGLIFRDTNVMESIAQSILDGKRKRLETVLTGPAKRFYEITVDPVSAKAQIKKLMEPARPLTVISFHDVTAARRADQMRTDFVANAGHELKTPLTSLLGFIETLSGPAKNDAGAYDKFLPIMHGEAERMVRVINDLLSLSRIEAEEHLHPKGEVSLAEIARTTKSTLDILAAKRGMKITLAIPADTPHVQGDTDQMLQMLHNLVNNAIKYGREKSTVKISARPVARLRTTGKPGVALTVHNQGEAIPAEHIPRLTERFYRVDAARSRKVGGTGLGLAIVKHIVTRHLGTLQITSTRAKGTTFTIALPHHSR